MLDTVISPLAKYASLAEVEMSTTESPEIGRVSESSGVSMGVVLEALILVVSSTRMALCLPLFFLLLRLARHTTQQMRFAVIVRKSAPAMPIKETIMIFLANKLMLSV